MSDVKIFKYKTNLQRKMSAPGGRTVEQALAAAEGAVESHRGAAMEALDRTLGELETACAGRAEARIYDLAAALLDMAGFFDTGPFHQAVLSLCEVSDGMSAAAAWDWPSIEVHVRALRLILREDCRESANSIVLLEGLAAIRRRALTSPVTAS
jgi:hypothetical protein